MNWKMSLSIVKLQQLTLTLGERLLIRHQNTHSIKYHKMFQNLVPTLSLLLSFSDFYAIVIAIPSPKFPAPKNLIDFPLVTHNRTLVGGGPSNSYLRAIEAIKLPAIGNFENATVKLLHDIKCGLRYLLQTENKWTLAIGGSGSLGIDILLDNLIEPGDVVLIPLLGLWGRRNNDTATRLGAVVKTIEVPLGSALSVAELRNAIVTFKPKLVFLVNGESSTGVVQRFEGIGDLCRIHNCLLATDIVATVGVLPFLMDEWKVDACVFNTQKGLGAPAGMAIMSFGPRAVDKILARKAKTKYFLSDFQNNWYPANYWLIDEEKPQTFFSSYPVLQLYAMRESLATIAAEGLESIWRRSLGATQHLHKRLEDLGIKHFVKEEEERLTGTIAMKPPTGIEPIQLMSYIREKASLEINVGLGPTFGKLIRFGLFGPNANNKTVDHIIMALKDGLDHFEYKQ